MANSKNNFLIVRIVILEVVAVDSRPAYNSLDPLRATMGEFKNGYIAATGEDLSCLYVLPGDHMMPL